MDAGVEIAFIVAGASIAGGIGSFASGLLMARMASAARIEERRLDWARADEVAKKVEETATQAAESTRLQRIAVDQATEAARLLKINQQQGAQISKETLGTIRVVHTLVNSKLTGVTQKLLDSQQRLLSGEPLTAAEVNALRKDVSDLNIELEERANAQRELNNVKNAAQGGGEDPEQ